MGITSKNYFSYERKKSRKTTALSYEWSIKTFVLETAGTNWRVSGRTIFFLILYGYVLNYLILPIVLTIRFAWHIWHTILNILKHHYNSKWFSSIFDLKLYRYFFNMSRLRTLTFDEYELIDKIATHWVSLLIHCLGNSKTNSSKLYFYSSCPHMRLDNCRWTFGPGNIITEHLVTLKSIR